MKYSHCTINNIFIDSITLKSLRNFKGKERKLTSYRNEENFKKIERRYFYKNYFDFSEGRIQNFYLLDSNFYFSRHKIRIGDSEYKIKSLFPASFKEGKKGLNYEIKIDLENTGKFLLIKFKNNKVFNIRDYNELGFDQ